MNPGNGTAQVGDGEVGPLPARNNAVEQIFGNPVIWKIIGSYLNLGDLKACRLVNSQFHGMVMKEANFLQRCLVSLKPHQISRNHFGSTSEPWRNLLLKFGNPGTGEGSSSDARFDHEELEWLYPLMSNVESLSLRMEKGSKGDGDGFHPLLKRLLNAPKALRALALEPIFIMDDKTENFDAWENALEHLEEFQILQPPLGWRNGKHIPIFSWIESTKLNGKMRKLRVLKSCYHPLPAPEFSRGITAQEHSHVSTECMVMSDVLKTIAPDSRITLKHVTVGGICILGLFESVLEADNAENTSDAFSFPSLESATFYVFQYRPCTVTKYILNLPMLKELEFSVEAALPITVLNAIGQRSDCLRKLKIQSSSFKDANWQFLQNTKIEEFRLELHNSDCPQGETLPDEVLNSLPLTIRRLFVRARLESNPISALARLNPSLVTQLSFLDSGDCFTDDTMRFIIENFRMLRKLNVTNAKCLTDAGFVCSSSESDSLSEIKGLRTLILRECGLITDATLSEIRFLELHYLDLSYNKQLTKEGYEGLLKTNPSLETLLMSCESIYDRKTQMYESHPRLSSVVYRRLKP